MKNYLITGGTGFLGLNFIRKILKSSPESKIDIISRNQGFSHPSVSFIEKSLTDIQNEDLEKCYDVVVLFAAISTKNEDYESIKKVNVDANLNIVKIVITQNPKVKIIFPSSQTVYQDDCELKSELSEELNYENSYTRSKLEFEEKLKDLKDYHKEFTYSIFRISNPFGIHIPAVQGYNYANQLLLQLYENREIKLFNQGSEMKNFIPIETVSDVIFQAGHGEFTDQIVNLGYKNSISLEDFYKLAQKIFGNGKINQVGESIEKKTAINCDKLYTETEEGEYLSHEESLQNFKSFFDQKGLSPKPEDILEFN